MMKRLLILMILALATGARAQAVFSQEQILDFYGQPAAPANPPTNYGRVYYDTATSQLKCLNSDGTNCLSSAGSGTVTSVSGTTNQINVATGTTTPVVSLSSTLALPGTLSSATAGAASVSPFTLTGTNFVGTGTTSTPLFYINQGTAPTTWSTGTGGTLIGLNAVTGFTGNFVDFHLNGGTSLFAVNQAGATTIAGSFTAGAGNNFVLSGRSKMGSPTDGVMLITNNGGTQLTRLDLGLNTSSGPALCQSGTIITECLGDGTSGGTFLAPTSGVIDTGGFGSQLVHNATACETGFATTTLGTGATTTNTGVNCLPANSIIDAVVARVTTTITGSCTGWSLGDASTAARFASNNTTLTNGTTTDATHIGSYNNTGIASATTGIWQAAAAPVKITCAGGNPSAGAIRIIVYSHTPTAPTS